MKIALKIASVLTWFNIVLWGICVGFGLLLSLTGGNLPVLAMAALLSAVPLNCYAALRLHASIRHPQVPLSHHTPAGIRFVGFIALFFGISWIFYGVSLVHDPKTAATAWAEQMDQLPSAYQQYPQFKNLSESTLAHTGIVLLVLGFFVTLNVILNLRLLRWYYLVKKSDVS